MIKFKNISLAPREQIAFRLHIIYSLIEGIILGVFALNEFVFIKSLDRSSFELGILFQFSMIVFLFLFFINEFIKRVKNKKKMVLYAGIITRLPLMALFFFPSEPNAYLGNSYYHIYFLMIFLIYYLGNPIIYPHINYFLKNSYRHENFGLLYGYSTSANKLVMLVVTFFYGMWLDVDAYAFRYMFPAMAILGIISTFFLSLIPYKEPKAEIEIYKGIWAGIKKSANNMKLILKTNRPFLLFQIAFMFYGYAFMASSPAVIVFYKDVLDINYSSVAFYRNAYNILAIIMLPLTGRYLDRVGPGRFGIITFLSLALYFLFVGICQYFPANFEAFGITFYWMLLVAVIFHGAFAATMALLWNIGSAYFCKKEEAGEYQNVHLVLTGARALFAPLLGVYILEAFNFTLNFSVSIISLVAGMIFLNIVFKSKK